ncbi:hypothetical protein K470DRAFT_296531 [Piedraia hortae CBS 480.64]|uniref:Uncharacterized protein n=1 Tax=Piedraia hortae CBS 480.64 TaxID=1314780 RepID=A0A6A7BU82_9PEZI|nr:hypothetical protein K470DRAFT_296531 [Piedraia hortae CBS 480.64]
MSVPWTEDVGARKIKPYLRRWSHKDDNRLDLSKFVWDHDSGSRHGRNVSGGSRPSMSGSHAPYVHPMRLEPSPFHPPMSTFVDEDGATLRSVSQFSPTSPSWSAPRLKSRSSWAYDPPALLPSPPRRRGRTTTTRAERIRKARAQFEEKEARKQEKYYKTESLLCEKALAGDLNKRKCRRKTPLEVWLTFSAWVRTRMLSCSSRA